MAWVPVGSLIMWKSQTLLQARNITSVATGGWYVLYCMVAASVTVPEACLTRCVLLQDKKQDDKKIVRFLRPTQKGENQAAERHDSDDESEFGLTASTKDMGSIDNSSNNNNNISSSSGGSSTSVKSAPVTPFAGNVSVQVIAGRNLISKDSNGFSGRQLLQLHSLALVMLTLSSPAYPNSLFSPPFPIVPLLLFLPFFFSCLDPYVTVGILDERRQLDKDSKQKTKVVSKTLNPKYSEQPFLFPTTKKDTGIQIEVYDEDKIGKDEFMGQVVLTPANFTVQGEQWFALKPRPGKGHFTLAAVSPHSLACFIITIAVTGMCVMTYVTISRRQR